MLKMVPIIYVECLKPPGLQCFHCSVMHLVKHTKHQTIQRCIVVKYTLVVRPIATVYVRITKIVHT